MKLYSSDQDNNPVAFLGDVIGLYSGIEYARAQHGEGAYLIDSQEGQFLRFDIHMGFPFPSKWRKGSVSI